MAEKRKGEGVKERWGSIETKRERGKGGGNGDEIVDIRWWEEDE